ncbi:MAG: restriction endonuclease subunit S [Acutalibacteraceae bacterium]|nr:restriction endonuclease subunit S [Acutalibacteraceae bacterium]
MSWETIKLGDIANFSNGVNFDKSAYSKGVKLIGVSNFGNRFYPDYDSLEEIKKEIVRTNDYLLDDDIVFVRSNGNKELVGRCMLIKNLKAPVTYSGFCIRARLQNVSKYYPVFFAYYFKSANFRKTLTGTAIGANIQNLSQSRLSSCIVKVPTYNTQKYIANILSAYDDLIENNQKQIKLLEEMAQRLYKEWFVDLRFSNYENTPIVDGVPQGWNRERLVDIADVQYGFAFDGSQFNSEGNGMPIIRIRNIPSGITKDYTTEKAHDQYIVKNGDIVVGMDGEFHINSWCGSDSYLVQRTCCIKPKNTEMNGYLLQAIHKPIKFFESTVVGATVAHLGKKHIDTITILTAPDKLYKPFQQYFNKRQLLLNQNQMLAEARDRLLPKLMSGEIDI